jgi:hypothetical protein
VVGREVERGRKEEGRRTMVMGACGRKKTENQVMFVIICVAVVRKIETGRRKRRRTGKFIVVSWS